MNDLLFRIGTIVLGSVLVLAMWFCILLLICLVAGVTPEELVADVW